MSANFGVVDLFAGPGGLGEGFASLRVDGHARFDIRISVEKEASAHRTLCLRSFLRKYSLRHGALPQAFVDFHAGGIKEPDWKTIDPNAWQSATDEARCLELGTRAAASVLNEAIQAIRREYGDNTVLIGGPPCQAYSVAGRVRSRAEPGYVAEKDARHYLFREYLTILNALRPAAFVMENVRGMLSSTVGSRLVFKLLMEELASLGSGQQELYKLYAIRVNGVTASLQQPDEPRDFVVCAEDFGVPQRRHRVIIIGIRSDRAVGVTNARIRLPRQKVTVHDAIGNLPLLRSGLSRGADDAVLWREAVIRAAGFLTQVPIDEALHRDFSTVARRLLTEAPARRDSSSLPDGYGTSDSDLLQWLERPQLRGVAQHETRAHMEPDLERYLFASVYGKERGCSPKAKDFPQALSPDHRNWKSGAFSDRFRVQVADEPSTTITSHISKDGHYYIHYDPIQCRSFTVREAARLQTFPDDYLFLGNRTQQYVQVGNAVPPLLARQIADLLYQALTLQNVVNGSVDSTRRGSADYRPELVLT